MSSLDSQFLCLGTMFTKDIVGHYFQRDASDANQIRLARGFIIAVVTLTYLLGLLKPPSVFALGVWCFSGFSSLFPLVFAALYWKRLTKWGAYGAVLATVATWGYFFSDAIGQAIKVGNPGPIRTYTLKLNLGGEAYEIMPVAAIFLASLIAMVAASLLTRPPKPETLKKFFAD